MLVTSREEDWIYVAEKRKQWVAVVNTVMNIWVALKAGRFYKFSL
jgi:hypothetical protein